MCAREYVEELFELGLDGMAELLALGAALALLLLLFRLLNTFDHCMDMKRGPFVALLPDCLLFICKLKQLLFAFGLVFVVESIKSLVDFDVVFAVDCNNGFGQMQRNLSLSHVGQSSLPNCN